MSLDNPPGHSQGQSQPTLPRDPQLADSHGERTLPTPSPTQIVMNGLKLKLPDQTEPFDLLSYALSSLTDKCVPVNWKPLVTDDVESQHIRCHELREGDELSMLVANFKAKHAKALILINTQDNYYIVPQFLEGLTKGSFPIVVLTQSDGSKLLSILNRHGDNVLARLDAESDVDTQLPQSLLQPSIPALKEASGFGQKLKAVFGLEKGSTVDLKAELKKLMFSPDQKPQVVSDDPARFISLMFTMTNYEKQAKEVSNHSDVNQALKKIRPHFEELFVKDLPLYIAIAFRLHIRSPLYQCEEMRWFIASCLSNIESMKPMDLAQAITHFVKRNDFKVMCGQTKEEESVSMFWFLECACQKLSAVSFGLKSQVSVKHQNVQKPIYSRFCYTRMMWLSLALKFNAERVPITKSVASMWQQKFIQFHPRIILTDAVLKDIVDGLAFGNFLNLPDEFTFNFQLLTDLAVSDKCIRPFKHLRRFISTVENYAPSEDVLIATLIKIRMIYSSKMKEPNISQDIIKLEETLAETITEAINFLDFLNSLWERRKFKEEAVNTECAKWFQLLLSMVDISKDHPDFLFSKFFTRCAVCKKHRKFIISQIMHTTLQNMSRLSIQQFFTLFKSFHFWPNTILAEYLKKYKVPAGTKVNDSTCKEFFSEVVSRFPNPLEHYYLSDFITKISERYKLDGCVDKFVLDLLRLGVPKIFSVPDEGSDQLDIEQARNIGRNFSSFLRYFIHGSSLKNSILKQMTEILNAISEKDEFQQLILEVLHEEVIPGFKALQTLESNTNTTSRIFKATLMLCTSILTKELSWVSSHSAKDSFCWGLVVSCCSHIHVTREQFDWVHSYLDVITELGGIFGFYCSKKNLTESQRLIIEALPDDICTNSSDNVKRYFEWIQSMQSAIQSWKIKHEQRDVNFDDILKYALCQFKLEKLCETLCCTSLVVHSQTVETSKNSFLEAFELLNMYLLRYIPQHPDAKWCSFPALLKEYGVTIPEDLKVEKYVVFPNTISKIRLENIAMRISPATTGQFQPGCDISLRLSNDLSLKKLSALIFSLEEFQFPLVPYLETLTFFKLNGSVMFDKYIRVEIECAIVAERVEESQKDATSVSASLFEFSDQSKAASSLDSTPKLKAGGVSVSILKQSLEKTIQLLTRIVNGEAAYADIIANGKLDLKELNIEEEFTILKGFAITLNPKTSFEGLYSVRSLLELFQYTEYIQNIYDVCEQYHLHGCSKDAELKELQSLVNDVKLEDNNTPLTPTQASVRMKRIKELLCINRANDTKQNIEELSRKRSACLTVFPSVANSAEFYQFISEKQFYGEKGQAIFLQQYQLITAQLQHEEYEEDVLNHLQAAFKVITPFMDSKQNFRELMTKVTDLDTIFGLQTVNDNITTIQLWFSRAEGDTLQNVAKELDKILETGYYSFELPIDGEARMTLEYTPFGRQTFNMDDSVDHRATTLETSGSTLVSQIDQPLYVEESTEIETKQEQWNLEQISDFVRKLGFMSTEKEGGEKIKRFRYISDIAYRLLELYGQLRDLGHTDYSKDPLPCCIIRTTADNRVRETEATLEHWRKRVVELRSRYPWLLFFSIPKILGLYKLLSTRDSDSKHLDKIVCEISFLCPNDQNKRSDLKKEVKKKLFKSPLDDKPPLQVVGEFLRALFKTHKLPRRESFSSLVRVQSVTSYSLSHEFSQLLHYCPHYSQSQLIQTVIGICSGVPEAFEVFRCQPSTTEGELQLFLQRAAKHSLRSIVLEVNRLPFKLQEVLMQFNLLVQETRPRRKSSSDMTTLAGLRASPCIHFIETEPSVLRDVPWIQLIAHKEKPCVSFEEAQELCRTLLLSSKGFACIQLVLGAAGNGKTHYIKKQIQRSPVQLTIAVNEAFTPLKAISKLCALPVNDRKVSIFFNFTMLPPGNSVDKSECKRFEQLMEVIGWFFFDLLILGYVEDPATGKSFRIPGGLEWAIYIEVPSREKDKSSEEAMKQFREEVPTLSLLGTVHTIHTEAPYDVNEEVQLVCKYLLAYDIGGVEGIDRLCSDDNPVKFSLEPDLPAEHCQQLLYKHMPEHIRSTKITQRLFVKYMKRRCEFLEKLPAFYLNEGGGEYVTNEQGKKILTDTQKLGSTLMRTMLKEVSDFCDPAIKKNWSTKPHQQLIYDYTVDCGASIGLISLSPQNIPQTEKDTFEKLGIRVPSMIKLSSRELLDEFLSRALNIRLENNRLVPIDDSAYVLTLDYTIKMLNIHERYECGVPVIIEGETGVGKTALIEMLSKLWNKSLLLEWEKQQDRIMDKFRRRLGEIEVDIPPNYEACLQAVHHLSEGHYVGEDHLLILCQLHDGSGDYLHTHVQKILHSMKNDPMVAQLTLEGSQFKGNVSLEQLFDNADANKSPEATARLLHAVFCAQIKPTFHKINVHAAMTPEDIKTLLKPAFDQAKKTSDFYQRCKYRVVGKREPVDPSAAQVAGHSPVMKKENFLHKMPFVTVFLDEINTSSCLGLFKEIIVDRTFDGEPIPDNVFIVAACNPHRGNSVASLGIKGGTDIDKEKWVRGTYYVRKLHPTLRFLMWDYGSLDEHQEKAYIRAKMIMLNQDEASAKTSILNKGLSESEVASLTELIVGSQKEIRKYAFEEIEKTVKGNVSLATSFAHSSVSQRDIQRVFTFYQWFMKVYEKFKPHDKITSYKRRAVLVALGIVYYMRLNNQYRKKYIDFLEKEYESRLAGDVKFTAAFQDELNWYIKLVELPNGIARTQALKENIFANIVCTATHTPLIIVGAPGSSKTLSFNQTIANLKGAESRVKIFRETSIFRSLDPQYYQCSRRTTSIEIQTVFSRAINRQRSHSHFKLPIYCVVFMDEAGLPEESHESLKVLHYHLDKQEVAFVGITNHVLDAAKTNRAICLFRPEASKEDLHTLAKGCFCSNPESPPPELELDLKKVVQFCEPYLSLMKDKSFARFFGLRDYIQFVNYLRRKRKDDQSLNSQVVMCALERNFNGYGKFEEICSKFLGECFKEVKQRDILDILRASFLDQPQEKLGLSENEVRYKLIIDPSEDDSLVRLLFTFGILSRKNTRIFVCSNFPADGHLQKINTIAAIRHSAIEGHTVVMSQTDDIHESFYDLFNQRFRRIDDLKEGPRYYTNIAIGAHLKPSRVHPKFQCVVIVKKSEIENTPAPFLNRFEKYLLSHQTMLETVFNRMPPSISVIIRNAIEKVKDFIALVSGSESLYGLRPDTLNSLVISLLPSVDHAYQEMGELKSEESCEIKHFILREIVQALRCNTGLFIPKCTVEEFNLDVDAIFDLVLLDPKFEGLIQNITHLSAAEAIQEAMNILHSNIAPNKGVHCDVSPEGCLVIAILQQWLVRYLCKRLMQLMTPEALILQRNKIPSSYFKNYLNFHTHFSLHKLVESFHKASDSTQKHSSKSPCPKKILCFTRSSPFIHELPSEFPSSGIDKKIEDKVKKTLKKLVFTETEKLVTYKMSRILSQATIQDLIMNFLESNEAEVCLLVINMQEISREIVNHVRILIEEAEAISKKPLTKIFVILLHFPPAQFFQPCYPSLFLKGWDHCYLDTIAHSTVEGVVDIRDWFWQCCFPQQSSKLEKDTLLETLLCMLPQAIPILVSRVFFGSRQNGYFNCNMNGRKRTDALNQLLQKKGSDGITVDQILCEKFRAYWKPSEMVEQLEKAAVFSRNRESTLSITDSIQTSFKNRFMDFLVYIISRINENYNLDILFNPHCSVAEQELFLEILKLFPTSKLPQITILSNNLHQPKPLEYTPKFPFFKLIFEIMEKIVEQSREEANLKLDCLSDPPESSFDDSHESKMTADDVLKALETAVTNRITEKMEGSHKQILILVTEAISKHSELWKRYFNDFAWYKLQLDSENSSGGIAQQILHAYLGHIHELKAMERMISLHTHLHVYQLNLAKVASRLRPLDKLHKLYKETSAESVPGTPTSPLVESFAKQTKFRCGSHEHVTTLVVTTLFNALNESLADSSCGNARVWHTIFRDLMILPNLKQYIHLALGKANKEMRTEEAKMDIMQVTFLVLQINPDVEQNDDILQKGQQVFRTLLTRHFNEAMEKTSCVRLGAVAELAVEVVENAGLNSSLPSDYNESIRIILEGLLAHFFSPERQCYNSEDIRWFLNLANSQRGGEDGQVERIFVIDKKELPAVSLNMLKHYLGRILGQCEGSEENASDPLQFYYQPTRKEIGVILTSNAELSSPGPYIPTFYKRCSFIKISADCENSCMEQPLAHLYFLTVLEHLRSIPYKFFQLTRLALNISTICSSEPTSNAAKAVLYIELQAVIQVTAQQLALHLDPSQPEKFEDILSVTSDLNKLMDDEATGGGSGGGHEMVVALHVLKMLKSSRRFTDLFLKKYESMFLGIECLKPFYEWSKTPADSYAHLLPFMMPTAKGQTASLYEEVKEAMTTIHRGSEPVESLKQLAEKCAHLSESGRLPMDLSCTFRMLVWLVTYYEFYCNKKPSKPLCEVIGSPEMLPYLREEGYVRMVQCFLFPDLMIHREEAPNVLREDEAVLELTPNGRHQPIKRRGNEMDPVYELFMPPNPEQQDQSDIDLRHSLANLVAIVMGCPSRSNHLWFHMFAPQELVNTYMTGFMYNSKISPDGLQYDCGVELTAEGEFGRSDYLKHAGRGTYTLHSLYLILWANFGAFTMSLLTLPDADAQIRGNLISEWQSIRHYCVSQLKTVWQHMRNNLALSEEERTFFVNRCLKTFHEVASGSHKAIQGIFATQKELDDYERMWHLQIFQPTWNELQDKFAAYSSQKSRKNILFSQLRCLEIHYPHFPSEAEFVHCILSCGDLEQHSEGGKLRFLSDFAQSWRTLQAGGRILPDLVEFYRWLHTELSHLITYERATAISIKRVVQLVAKRYGSPMGDYILALYDRVKKGYNGYVEMIGGAIGAGACAALKQGNKIYTIADDVPLLHFLTDSVQEEEGNDWLFTVIAHIVNAHNLAIENMYSVIHSQDQFHLKKQLSDQPAKILLTEITDATCIIGKLTSLHGVSSLLQVIRSRHQPPSLKSSDTITQGSDISSTFVTKFLPKFQLRLLEEDLVRLFTAGKPLIESPFSIRTLFKFKYSSNPENLVVDEVTNNLEEVGEELPKEYKDPLSAELHKQLEYEFHSCDYGGLMKVITALQTVCSHLKKVIMENFASLNKEDLIGLTLPEFLTTYVYQHLTDPEVVLSEIGITTKSLKHSQLGSLVKLPLPKVFACLQLFIQWVDQGLYDFCNLPLTLKAHLSKADHDFFDCKLRDLWTGTPKDLEVEVKQLIDVLKHSESDISKIVNEQTPRTSIIEYLKKYLLVSDTDQLSPLIPETVVFHHYVHFRLALRRLLMRLRAKSSDAYGIGEGRANQWSEFVADLWSVSLSHLREETFEVDLFVLNASTGLFGFEDEPGTGYRKEEGLMSDFENDQQHYEQDEGRNSTINLTKRDSVSIAAESVDLNHTLPSDFDNDEEECKEEKESEQPTESSTAALNSVLQENPEILKAVEQKIKQRDNALKAKAYTPEDVGDFLSSIKLDKYREAFVSDEVRGDVLLEADSEFLTEFGVSSPLDRVRIMTLFPRRLQEAEPRFPVSEVLRFLRENGFEKYMKHFEENQIDGDMILHSEAKLVLKEIDIKIVDRMKILVMFKTFASEATVNE